MRLLFGITGGNFIEAGAGVFRGQRRHGFPGLALLVFGDFGPAFVGFFAFGATRSQILFPEIPVDGLRRLDAAAHRLDGDPGAGVHVSRGKDSRPGGLVRGFVHFYRAPAGQLDAAVLQTFLGRFLPDGRHDHIHRQFELRPGHGHRPAATRGVRFPQLHLLADEARDLAVRSRHHLMGSRQIDDFHPFAQGLLHFMGERRHLLPGTAVDDGHIRTQAPGRAGHVNGHVAAADDRQPLADGQGLAQIVAPEKLDSLHDAVGVLAFDPQGFAHMAADSQENGLISLLKEAIHGEIPPQGGIGLKRPPPGAGYCQSPGPIRPWAAGSRGCPPGACLRPGGGPRRWWAGSLAGPTDRHSSSPPAPNR